MVPKAKFQTLTGQVFYGLMRLKDECRVWVF